MSVLFFLSFKGCPTSVGFVFPILKSCRYVSLEPPDIRVSAMEDPRTFIEIYPPPVIFDEVQYAPDLLPYVKEKIDSERHKSGRYFLAGSQNLLLMEKVTESLAGRAAILCLLPLSRREAEGRPQVPLRWESERQASPGKATAFHLSCEDGVKTPLTSLRRWRVAAENMRKTRVSRAREPAPEGGTAIRLLRTAGPGSVRSIPGSDCRPQP